MIVEGRGIPPTASSTGGNLHDSTQLCESEPNRYEVPASKIEEFNKRVRNVKIECLGRS